MVQLPRFNQLVSYIFLKFLFRILHSLKTTQGANAGGAANMARSFG